jgi:putative flippase GtrA
MPSPFIRFVIAGGIAAAINILSRIGLSHIVSYEIAVVLAYLVGMTAAYLLMKIFVFAASGKSVINEYMRFGLVNIVALAQVWIVSVGLMRWAFPIIGMSWHPETSAHIIGVLVPVFTSYIGHKHYTFGTDS